MLKYLIVQLDDLSPSFCHYSNNKTERRLIDYNSLKEGLIWAMKENLMVQIVYPDYELPEEYLDLIESIDHIDIKACDKEAEVAIFNGKQALRTLKSEVFSHCLLRMTMKDLIASLEDIKGVLKTQRSLNIVITDIEKSTDEVWEEYQVFLKQLGLYVADILKSGKLININLLTDRIFLKEMNNCGAGNESITLAPDGNFYICPAFYLEEDSTIGNPSSGVKLPNANLYKLENAPICRACDAFQCKRCVWLNKKLTLEVNTPSKQQCIIAHLERNSSRTILELLEKGGEIFFGNSIPEVDYLDPFEKIKR